MLRIFWLLVKVVITTEPSGSTPYHIGIGCGIPSRLIEVMMIVCDFARKSRSSASVIWLWLRRQTAAVAGRGAPVPRRPPGGKVFASEPEVSPMKRSAAGMLALFALFAPGCHDDDDD